MLSKKKRNPYAAAGQIGELIDVELVDVSSVAFSIQQSKKLGDTITWAFFFDKLHSESNYTG